MSFYEYTHCFIKEKIMKHNNILLSLSSIEGAKLKMPKVMILEKLKIL